MLYTALIAEHILFYIVNYFMCKLSLFILYIHITLITIPYLIENVCLIKGSKVAKWETDRKTWNLSLKVGWTLDINFCQKYGFQSRSLAVGIV